MNSKDFSVKIMNLSKNVSAAMKNSIPDAVGTKAADFFKESFHKEGFTDKGFEKWKEVKRRTDPRVRGARATRKILTGDTGDLGESIKHGVDGNGNVVIYSDKPYAVAQNEGTTNAGRNHTVTIPARKFIGDSNQLNKIVETEIKKQIDKIFK